MLIVVVDNNPVMLKLMTNLLEKEGHKVLTAKDGLSALRILRSYIPDVIFTDLVMPNIDGRNLTQIVRHMPGFEDVCIIVLSAVAAEELSSCTEFGADACIVKGPFRAMAEHVLSILQRCQKGELPRRSGQLIGLDGVRPRTITKELLSAKRHLEIVLKSMSEGILELTPDGKIVYVNPAAASLLEKSETEILSSDFTEFFDGGDHRRVKELLESGLDRPQAISDESPIVVNGKQLTVTILPIKEGESQTLILILNDITRRKMMEAKVRESEKMQALGTLAGGIAHDFNNLLMGILGNVSLMLLDVGLESQIYERLKDIEQYALSASALTKQLLGFARGGKYEVKPCDINKIIQESSEMFGRTRKQIKIHRKFQKGLWPVEADRSQIEQVLLNLYLNAWQAMSGRGDLYLETRNIVLSEGNVRSYAAKPGKYIKISVIDTGIGMDDETRRRIFEPFFTTKKMRRGTGLGLASAYGIIKNHGGFIEVYSEKGSGAKFDIYLPASETWPSPSSGEHEREELCSGNETILLVDDEKVIIDVGKPMLEALGYEVLLAKSGREALEVYKDDREKIALVILDMIMPDMGGGETYDKLRQLDPEVRVLLSSGYSLNGEAQVILDRGCKGFIQKPFTITELSEKIRKILCEHHEQGQDTSTLYEMS